MYSRKKMSSTNNNMRTSTVFVKCLISLAFWVDASYTIPTNGVCGQCGTNNRNGSYITLKTAAYRGEIPWQVGLVKQTGLPFRTPFNIIFGPRYAVNYFCTGTLINANWVLTARHCTLGRHPRSLWAHLGVVNRRNAREGLVIQIDGKAEYPVYSYPTYLESDVALLRLKHGVDLANSPNINSICWPTVTPHDGQQVIATGWGIKFQGMRQYGKSQLLQKASMSLISDKACKLHSAPIRAATLCAWGVDANSCQGDSGGPLVGWNNGVWELYGAISWGNNNCQINLTPMGFVDIREVIGWISSIAGSECPRNYPYDITSQLP